VPGIFVAVGAASSSADRGHSLRSLHPPPAALPSLPRWLFVHGAYLVVLALRRSVSFLRCTRKIRVVVVDTTIFNFQFSIFN